MTTFSWMIGELPNPHSAIGMTYQPELRTPRFFCQSSFPSRSKQNSPSDPKNATTCLPSVAGVELAWLDLVCRLILGTLSVTVRCQRMLPAVLSRQSTSQLYLLVSLTGSTSP